MGNISARAHASGLLRHLLPAAALILCLGCGTAGKALRNGAKEGAQEVASEAAEGAEKSLLKSAGEGAKEVATEAGSIARDETFKNSIEEAGRKAKEEKLNAPTIHRIWESTSNDVGEDGVRTTYTFQRDYTAAGTEKFSVEMVFSKVSTLRFFIKGVNGYSIDGDKLVSYGGEVTHKAVTINGEAVSNPSTDDRTKGIYKMMLDGAKETARYRIGKIDEDTLTLIDAEGDKEVYTAIDRLMKR